MGALEEQVGCYRKLAKLAAIQHEHVRREQTEQLLDVLKSRAEVVQRIGMLEALVGPAKKSWPTFVGGMSGAARAKAEQLMSEAKRLLKEITTSDKNDVLVLQQRKINLGRQIGQATAARQVNRTYAAAAAYGSARSNMDVQR
jgi:hypothetical protein